MSDHLEKTAPPPLSSEYLAREKRFNDAVALRKPDRVPMATMAISFMTRYAGLSDAEAFYDYERGADAWLHTTKALNFDITGSPIVRMPGGVMELLGLKTFKWPGYDLDSNLQFQFVEKEYMTAEEYQTFLRDPSDFTVRFLIPRFAKTLEPLGMLPPLYSFSNPYAVMSNLSLLAGVPPLVNMFKKIGKICEEMGRFMASQVALIRNLAESGYPIAFGAVSQCPFDWISDYMRGMKGSMFDLFRAPAQLKETMDLFLPVLVEGAVVQTKQTGNSRVFPPLHRGADGFMSNKQYADFYWPGLKKLFLSLIDMFADSGGLIVDGAVESIPGESRPENVAAMVETVFEYGKL